MKMNIRESTKVCFCRHGMGFQIYAPLTFQRCESMQLRQQVKYFVVENHKQFQNSKNFHSFDGQASQGY
ncbi:CLUMA_CG011778, isoform A [Clunio marinus]|uniref:CLUMA_CG011778, isoform A n=1 Tax=Clunio marinus TaxID=568069 RepID=A0A1J1IFV8_9DIPT|nr:CLUMA_CG011778, isoform A [Clunio marinus]